MLFVDDDKTEVLELDVTLQELVRADGDVDAAFGDAFQRIGSLLRRAKTRKLGDFHRPVGEAIGEGIEVLLRKQRRGDEHDDLLAVGYRNKSRAQRHFGLAEAHITAYET